MTGVLTTRSNVGVKNAREPGQLKEDIFYMFKSQVQKQTNKYRHMQK